MASFQVGEDLQLGLRQWCRKRRTTLAMSIFAAYVALVLRWCHVSEGVFLYQTDGRASAKIANTVGFFAAKLHLRLELFYDDTFVDLLARVTQEYCSAACHADFGYLGSQQPSPEFTRNPIFNWLPRETAGGSPGKVNGEAATISASRIQFHNPTAHTFDLDYEPMVTFTETNDTIVARIHYPLDGFSANTMERFGRLLLAFILRMVTEPAMRVRTLPLE
jgi:non-ribosomal peptide synthetase component F